MSMNRLSMGPLAVPKSKSPDRRGRDGKGEFRTPTKKKDKNTFPTTPRSVEKQKKMLGARLKRLMEQHLRMSATNKMLTKQNKALFDQVMVSNFDTSDVCLGSGSRQQQPAALGGQS